MIPATAMPRRASATSMRVLGSERVLYMRYYLFSFAIFSCKDTNNFGNNHILAFCFSPAPLPRYFERASLNFHVRLSMKVRRVGFFILSHIFLSYSLW